jgi:uncharacterized protein YdaU (DUF1376 family)
MPDKKYMPQYHCWSENDFQSDRQVQRLPYPARRLYRVLLQAAFTCPTRPYLPANDEELYLLAEADDLEYWSLHKGPVLKMFTPFKGKDGEDLLERKRLTRDWQQMTETIAQKQKAGRARHGKSAYGEHTAADALKTETENETETKTKTKSKLNQNKTETTSVSSLVSGSTERMNSAEANSGEDYAKKLLALWTELSGQSGSAADFPAILNTYVEGEEDDEEIAHDTTDEEISEEIGEVMRWALTVSSYWSKKLKGSGGFRNAYPASRANQRVQCLVLARSRANKSFWKTGSSSEE